MKKLLLVALVAISASQTSQMHAMNIGDVTISEDVKAAKAAQAPQAPTSYGTIIDQKYLDFLERYFALTQQPQPRAKVQTSPALPQGIWACPKDCMGN